MNRAKFQKSLMSLVGWREKAFMLALAERARPNAVLYFESVELSPLPKDDFPDGFDSLLDQIWQALVLMPDEESIVHLLDETVACLPDDPDEDHYGALPASDFIALLETALLGGINEDKRRAQDASRRTLETVTQFIEFSEGESLSENQLVKLFDRHPLVEREFSFQQELSDLLRSASHPSPELIAEIRALAQDEGVSNIGICLD